MIKRFTGYKNNKNSPKSPHKIFRPSLTEIIEQNLFYFVPFEKYWPIKLEQLAHFSYMTILLLHKKNIRLLLGGYQYPPLLINPNCGTAPKGGAV